MWLLLICVWSSGSLQSLSLTQGRLSQVEEGSLSTDLTSNHDTWPVHHITTKCSNSTTTGVCSVLKPCITVTCATLTVHCYMRLPFIMLLYNLMIQTPGTTVHSLTAVRLDTSRVWGVKECCKHHLLKKKNFLYFKELYTHCLIIDDCLRIFT